MKRIIFNSLKSRLMISVIGIVTISLTIIVLFFNQWSRQELSSTIEENALNILEVKKNHVKSQYNSINYHESAILSRRKIELKNKTDIAFSIIHNRYQNYKKGLINSEVAKKESINILKQIRYDENIGYFWINDIKRPFPRMIMHPTIPSLDEQILDDPSFNCALGKKENLFKAFVDVCLKNNDGYVDYLWPKPVPGGLTEQQPKISYVKLFKPWGWVIGTGAYIDDIKKDVQDRINAVITDLNKTILRHNIDSSGYFFIFNEKNIMLVHPNLKGRDMSHVVNPQTGNKLLDEFKKTAFSEKQYMEYLWDKPGFEGKYQFPKKVYMTYFLPLGWYIGSSVYIEHYEQKISNFTKTIVFFSIFFLILAIIISIIVSRSIINPLNMLVDSIKSTDKNGIPVEIIQEKGTTETRLLSKTINFMISSIKKSRKSIQQSEAKYRGLIESSTDLIWEVNIEGIFTYISPKIVDILGYTPKEVIGKTFFDLRSPENTNISKAIFKDLVVKKNSIISLENICLHKNGKPILLETNGVPFFDEDQKLIGYRGIDRNITIRKNAEEELNHIRKMDAIGQLAGGVAHDFNNILAGIMGAANLLCLQKETLEDKSLYYVNIILDSASRAADLTGKLLMFSRKSKISFTLVDVHNVINDLVTIFKSTIDKKIKILFEKKAKNHNVIGDSSELLNALMNIGINASHAMPDGGTLQISTKNIKLNKIYCSASPFDIEPGNYIEIILHDTGIGIPLDNFKKIFEPFYTTKIQGKGTGLGLAAVYGAVKSHNGAINVYSEINMGTSFNILIPCSTENGYQIERNQEVISGTGLIILVDDEEIIRITGEHMLKEMGYEVLLAENGKKAIDIFQKRYKEIDLVLMDMIMPEMNGSETFLKMKKIDKNCKVIISSGFTKNEDLNEMRKSGLEGFISKPFNDYELSHLIAKVLND